MKTIAIVLNTSWNIYNFRLGLLKALQENGYKVVAIAPRDNYSEKLSELGIEFHNININNKGTNPFEDTKLVCAYYKLYKKIAPDVLLQYTIKPNIYGSIAAGVLGIPVISNISGLGTVFLNDCFSSKVAQKMYQVSLRIPKKVFYQNAHDRALFIDSNLVRAEKTDLLPGSGIDTDKFKPLENTTSKQNKLRFLFIARLIKDKGLMEYVEAARTLKTKHSDAEFAILGAYYPGNPVAVTKSEMQAWEGEGIVSYLGSSDNVKSVIAQYDCVVLPSYREGLSRVLLEAASMAKPIVTTDVPGCKEVVDDGVNGFLCQPRNSECLAEQIQKMISLNPSERIQMGQKGREKVIKDFDEKIIIQKYLEAIKAVSQKGEVLQFVEKRVMGISRRTNTIGIRVNGIDRRINNADRREVPPASPALNTFSHAEH